MTRRNGPRSPSARSAGSEAVAHKAGARIEEHVLRNGMRVLVAERPADPVVTVMTWYKVGGRNEREEEAGVSHFLEHMMFKGSKGFGKGEVDRITTALGGQSNAFTGPDHTAYWFELASDRWEVALELEADRMQALTLDAAELEAERAVVLEELSMGADDPWRSLAEMVQAAVFFRHPYRRPVVGFPDTLRALTVEAMRDYYRRFYHPGNATLVLCGDLNGGRALKAARKHFGRIPAGPAYEEVDCYRGPLPEPRGQQRVDMRWDDPARRLMMAWPTAAVDSPEDYALDLASTILSGGRLSRLHRRLVIEEGLATNVSTNNDTRIDGGVFWLFAECAQGARMADLEAAVDEEMARIAGECAPAPELSRVKSMLKASQAYATETASDLAEQLGEFAVDAHWRVAIDGPRRLQRVSARQVRDAARRLLAPERRVVGLCLPEEKEPPAPRRRKSTGKRARKVRGRKKP